MDPPILLGQALKARLDVLVTPKMRELGLRWRGDYSWVEPGSLAIRRIVTCCLLKGAGAVFSWGLSLGFVPLLSGSRVTYHRTFKSARPDVFEWPASYRVGFSAAGPFQRIETWTSIFERSLAQYLPTVVPDLVSWFERVQTIDDIEGELRRQIVNPFPAYRTHYPRQTHVLAFVRAAAGDLTEGREILVGAPQDEPGGSSVLEAALMSTRPLD
jgi:hypothetical protein